MLSQGEEVAVATFEDLTDRAGEDRVQHGPAAGGRALDPVVAAAHLVDHRVRALHGLGYDAGILDGEEAPRVREAVLGPGPQHDVDRLVEALAVFLLRDVVALELGGTVAAAHADIETTLGDHIDKRQLLALTDEVDQLHHESMRTFREEAASQGSEE